MIKNATTGIATFVTNAEAGKKIACVKASLMEKDSFIDERVELFWCESTQTQKRMNEKTIIEYISSVFSYIIFIRESIF